MDRSRGDMCHGGMRWEDPNEESGGSWETCKRNPAPHLLPTVDEDEDFDDIFLEDQPVRSLFPESWFWKKITLPKSESG